MGSPPNGKNNGATIGFEAKLWQAADKLRNNMDAAEYKHVVLGLIFLKYISDSFEEMHNRLASGEADYEGANPEDQDEYRAENVFWVPIDLSVTSERVLSGRALMFGTAGSHRTVEGCGLWHRLLWSFLDSVYYLCNTPGRFRRARRSNKEGGAYRVLLERLVVEDHVEQRLVNPDTPVVLDKA
jgi:hypothetical protein